MRKTVCLITTLTDQPDNLMTWLESVKKYIDYWVIGICNHTNQSNEINQIITDYFARQNIPGEFHYVDNKNQTLHTAHNKADYALIIDTSNILSGDLKLPDNMDADAYTLKSKTNEFITKKIHLIENRNLTWCYVGFYSIECDHIR